MPHFHLKPEFSGPQSATRGTCFFCNLGRQKRDSAILDTNVYVEEYHRQGIIEICATCAGIMAGKFGWVAPDKAEQLRQEAAEALARLAQSEERLAAFTLLEEQLVTFQEILARDEAVR